MHTTRELLIKTDAVALSGAELNTGVSLSPRGKEVLELFMNGYTYQHTASQLGMRFKWGTVMEYFSNANFENGQRQSLDGAGGTGWQAGGLQDVSPGKKHGPQWRAAKEWEEEQHKLAEAGQLKTQAEEKPQTPTACEMLLAWGEAYLAHAERTMERSTWVGKKTHVQAFFAFCRKNRIEKLEGITKPQVYVFLSLVLDERRAKAANKYRKNLLAAWNWGMECVEGFPQVASPFKWIKPSPVVHRDRYVPSEDDVVKVLKQAEGQDLVFLLTLYFTGGRRGEIFRLSWEKDVQLDIGKIRLSDHKAGNGQTRFRWLDMHPELVKALTWWHEARPCKVDNVFMQMHCDGALGEPFQQRNKFMERLCSRAGVKPFGFHALRHKSAAITFVTSGLNAAQVLMGHYRATTTDRYVRSAGLYTDHFAIMTALGSSGIGQAVGSLLESKFPHELAPHGEIVTSEFVTQGLRQPKQCVTC